MFQGLNRREVLMVVAGVLVATLFTIVATNYVIQRFVIGPSDDPLVKAGGLSPAQRSLSPN
jgi:hypothetical protein